MSAQDVVLRMVTTAEQLPVADLNQQTIRDCVERAMRNYFNHLDGHDVSDVYQMVLAEVEIPLLEVVLEYTRNNQSRAAEVLGLNRGTLRKKLKQYNML
ncbi:MAG: DNA-binding transcriptional regulator Fis [Pseudomonadales bacterium]|nr:DNA-binding transcriptional regulator Fis [Cellvibrionales bacterium]MBP8030345.1 DNA-binding transcriptional regulator Fis [Pseudomonadales bacterium]